MNSDDSRSISKENEEIKQLMKALNSEINNAINNDDAEEPSK